MRAPAAWALAALVAAVLVAPLAAVQYLPFVDLPNHAARHYLAAHLDAVPALGRYYAFKDVLLPNSGADLLRALTGWDGDMHLFVRVVAGIFLVNLLASMMLVHRVFWGVWSAWPLAGAITAYNAVLWFGFENYYLAYPFVLHGLALWAGSARWAALPRWLALAALATAVYFMHIVAFGLLAAAVGLFELGRRPRDPRTIGLALLALLPPLVHFLVVVLDHGAGQDGTWEFGHLILRLAVFVGSVSRLPYWHTGPGEIIVAFACLGVLVLLVPVFLAKGWVRLAPGLVWPVAGLAVLALVVPERIMGLHVMQMRAPVVLAALLFAGLGWHSAPRRARAAVAVLVAALLLVRGWQTVDEFRARDIDRRAFIEAAGVIGPGSRVIAISSGDQRWLFGIQHMGAFLVSERHAFVVNLFRGANGLAVAPEWRHLSHTHVGILRAALLDEALRASDAGQHYVHPDVRMVFWRHWWRDFTHVVSFDPEPVPNPFPDLLEPVASGEFFTIYRIRGAE